jgi:hypothetical protein
MMQEQVAGRLAQLRTEFEAGHSKLTQLEAQETFLRERLLMLKGAIQVLEELQAEDNTTPGGPQEQAQANGQVLGGRRNEGQ